MNIIRRNQLIRIPLKRYYITTKYNHNASISNNISTINNGNTDGNRKIIAYWLRTICVNICFQ